MSEDYNVFTSIRMEAETAIGDIDMQINAIEAEFKQLRAEQKRLRAVIKATQEPTDNGSKPKTTKRSGIRLETRRIVMGAIRGLKDEHGNHDFTMNQLIEEVHKHYKLADSSINRAVVVMRDEGFIRMVGKEGQAPIYRWVGN